MCKFTKHQWVKWQLSKKRSKKAAGISEARNFSSVFVSIAESILKNPTYIYLNRLIILISSFDSLFLWQMSPELELSLCLIYNISIIVISKRQENYGSETLFWIRSRLHTPVFTDDIPRKILVSVYSSSDHPYIHIWTENRGDDMKSSYSVSEYQTGFVQTDCHLAPASARCLILRGNIIIYPTLGFLIIVNKNI